MSQETRIYLFGDQTYDVVPKLRELLQIKDNPILTAFLDQSHYVVRAQMGHYLPPKERKAARTSNLGHLVQKYCEGGLSPAFQTALACICQLGCFISQHGEIGKPYPRPEDTYVLGLCTGSLSAAAVSSCSTLSELLPAAVQTVLVAFRLGLCVVDVRDRLEPPSQMIPREWSMIVYGLEPEAASKAIKEFCQANVIPRTSQPWIGATACKASTICGPPSILKQMRELPSIASFKTKCIPIYVPAHSSHLFTTEDVKAILETTPTNNWTRYTAKLPIISGATGKLTWEGNFKALLERALLECLLEPLRWDKIIEEVPKLIRGTDSVAVTPIGTTAEQSLVSALSKSAASVVVDQQTTAEANLSHCTPAGKAKLAIVGMSGRFPESQSVEAFWDLLYKGLDVCKEVPIKRWNVATHVDPSGKARNKGATPWGCWLDFAGEFDPRFFSISPKEAPQMDPAQRMALMSSYEAMERAGIVTDATPSTQADRIGVFHGVTSNDWMEVNASQDIDTYFITGGNRGFIPGRINFCFEFSGPSFTNDTACSSSLAAIHLACNSLWRGDCDTAIAGGTNMIFNPDGHTGLDKGFFLSRTGNCKTFDDNADGYCRAEGVGTVFIKRLDDALADCDPILAVILDTQTNHSAMSESMTRPHVGAQIDNMNAVLNNACIDPKTVGYVEMHGTGTQVGDAVEMESVLSVFASKEGHRSPDQPLYLGSAKANIGHGEGVSGVTSLVKVLLMLKHDTIPPHCGIKPGSKINHNYPDLDARNVHIAHKPVPWARNDGPRRVLINNFSAAGGNTALLLEDAPRRTVSGETDTRTSHVVTVSAHVANSLKKNIESLLDYVTYQEGDELLLSQLSFTTTARRVHRLHRVSVVGSSISEIKANLQEALNRGDGMNRAKSKPNIVFAFTGQGCQYLGMGRQLFNAFPRFRADLRRCDQLAQSLGFPSFLHVFTATEGNIDDFTPVVVQLAVSCLQMALAALLISFGINPGVVVGHSLGEYAALNVAGVLTTSDTIYLVGKRAELLQERCTRGSHAMLAVRLSQAAISKLLTGTEYEIACINGPEDIVLSGPNEQIAAAQAVLAASGFKSTVLKVPYAFHSTQVDPILESFKIIASGATFHKPVVPVLCPLSGTVIQDVGTFSAAYLAQHCRGTVDIEAALRQANDSQIFSVKSSVIEVGPHPVVCGMVKATLGDQVSTFPTLQRNKDVWRNMAIALSALYAGGLDINWSEYHRAFKSSHKVLELPAYGWDLKDYYIPYEADWCVHKPRIQCACAGSTAACNHAGAKSGSEAIAKPAPKAEIPETPVRKLETTTVHKLVDEKIEALGASVIVETDISRPDVSDISQGHLVNNIPLCTPSVYADIAFTVGKYLSSRLRPGHRDIISVSDLVIDKALIPHGRGPQLLRTSLKVEWAAKAAGTTKSAQCEFWTVNDKGKATTLHAWCIVRFEDEAQLESLKGQVSEYRAKINRLREGTKTGQFLKYNNTSGYKLMSGVAQFHQDYRLLDDVVLNENELEACCLMSFENVKPGGIYTAHPAYVDAITQLGGFVMNAKDSTNLDKEVFVNHGWESFQVYEEMRTDRKYQVYVQMKHHKDDLYHGDTIVLDRNTVVAFFKGVSLRNLPRNTLRMVLQQTMDKFSRASNRGGPPASKAAGGSPRKQLNIAFPDQPAPAEIPAENPAAASVPALASPPASAPVSRSNSELALIPIKPQPITAAPKPKPDNAKLVAALAIISEESGIAVEDLTHDSQFADIGIDSLLSMVIGSRFREELGLDLDTDFSIFVDLPTVKDLKTFFNGLGGSSEISPVSELEPKAVEEEATRLRRTASTVDTAPEQAAAIFDAAAFLDEAATAEESPVSPDDAPPSTLCRASSKATAALEIVSEESGVAMEDLTDDTNFGDIGVDSLLSMVIGSRFREELGLDLDTDFSIFVDLPTVKQLREFLAGDDGSPGSDESSFADITPSETPPEFVTSQDTTPEDSDAEEPCPPKLVDYCKPATSVILQGIPKIAQKTLFLLPDGSGSSSSYVPIPRLKTDVAIVGLNCPYGRDPENMKCTHTAMINSYCDEIRRRQPNGPYHLGGWSSGGAMAYVCAETLVSAGEEVHSLIIIDAPVPQVMEIPLSFYELCKEKGLFPGGGLAGPPPHLIPHFAATVNVMLPYKVAPLKTHRMPRVGIIWATEPVIDEKDAQGVKGKGTHFMVTRRTDFGPDGWDAVLPGAEFVIDRVEGGNHFSIMQKDNIHQVRALIERVMA